MAEENSKTAEELAFKKFLAEHTPIEIDFKMLEQICPKCNRNTMMIKMFIDSKDPAYQKYGDICSRCLTKEEMDDFNEISRKYFFDMTDDEFDAYSQRHGVVIDENGNIIEIVGGGDDNGDI